MTPRQKAVDLAKKIAKERDSWTCQKCGRKKPEVQIQGSNIFPVTYGNVAADPENIIALYSSCHEWARDSWHMNPLESAKWFNETYPGLHDKLKAKAYPIRPIKKFEWETKLSELKSLVNVPKKRTSR